MRKQFYYYLSAGKKVIHWVEESIDQPRVAFQLFDSERIKKTDPLLMKSFLKRNPGAQGCVYCPIDHSQKVEGIQFLPWEHFLF